MQPSANIFNSPINTANQCTSSYGIYGPQENGHRRSPKQCPLITQMLGSIINIMTPHHRNQEQ